MPKDGDDETLDHVLIGITIVVGLIVLAVIINYIIKKMNTEKYCGTSLESLLPPKLSVHFYYTEKINLNIDQILAMVNFIQQTLRNKVIFYTHYVEKDLSSINAHPYNALIRVVNLVNNNEMSIPLAKTPELFMDDLADNKVINDFNMFYKTML
jgi:hypothetical protein